MLGIGVITYKRPAQLRRTIEHIKKNTLTPFRLIVADDGSDDDTLGMLQSMNISFITGPNHGPAWNKNRALFYLNAVAGCDPIILIEDDTFPVTPGWEKDWIKATTLWGHVNYAPPFPWFQNAFLSGCGSVEDPFVSPNCSGQCTSFSRLALSYVGYLDTRFKGFGYGHGEHSMRFLRMGFGGFAFPDDHGIQYRFNMLASELLVEAIETFGCPEQIKINEGIFIEIQNESIYRPAWRNDKEMGSLKEELSSILPSRMN